jgi:isopentenyl-diphosphate delta-isomerase
MTNENLKIALVNEHDKITGFASKQEVHEKGLLHRAFSIFIVNDQNEFLLQKRASTKYHSPNLWTNACCSHLIANSDFEKYMHERLIDEMGFDCKLEFKFSFHYRIEFENGLIENEIDHAYLGKWNGIPIINPEEANDFRWISKEILFSDLKQNPDNYTYWFKQAVVKIANGF